MFTLTVTRRLGPANLRFVRVTLIVLLLMTVFYLYLTTKSIVASIGRYHRGRLSTDVYDRSMGLDRVVITVKTGATEAALKVPTQLRTSLRYAPNVYVFSDMAQSLGSVEIYNSLDTIPAAVKDGNPDFDIYRKQQEIQNPEKIIETLHDFPHPGNQNDLAAWVLDKYKNNHIVEKTWALMPNMDWYFHVDADTYVFLPSLASWLPRLDPSKELLMGSLILLGDKEFAHGGSGILLSKAATRSFVVTHNGTSAKWYDQIKNTCCGDYILAQALYEYGIKVTRAWPTIQGSPLEDIDFGSDSWCQPIVTLHHISPAEADRIVKFENRRQNANAPVLYSELFYGLVLETIPSESRVDWDNSSGDENVPNITSMEACIAACANKAECLQLRFNGDECILGSKHAKLGKMDNPKDNNKKRWQSSWNRTRIVGWASQQKPCKKVVFPS